MLLAGGPGGRAPPLWRFLECDKSLKRAPKTALLMMQERRLSAEIQNLEKPKNSLRMLGTSTYIDKTEKYRLRRSSRILY